MRVIYLLPFCLTLRISYNIIPQIQNVQSQNCIYITCCSDSTGYFVKEIRYLLYLTFKVRYSKYLMLAWQLHATTRETPHGNILNMAATIWANSGMAKHHGSLITQ